MRTARPTPRIVLKPRRRSQPVCPTCGAELTQLEHAFTDAKLERATYACGSQWVCNAAIGLPAAERMTISCRKQHAST